MTEQQQITKYQPNLFIVSLISVLVTFLVTAGLLGSAGWIALPQDDRQTMVHDMGSQVMPFNLGDTTHIFEMSETGGIQQVVANDPNDAEQITLIRQHLQYEATRFASGDFSDPTSLHGNELPGIQELADSVGQVSIQYSELPDGGQITFTTQNLSLITAIHRWFGAQLSDHGSDATYR